jgi:hypothetical protein
MGEQHGIFKIFGPQNEEGETVGIVDDGNKLHKLAGEAEEATSKPGDSGETFERLEDHGRKDEK